MADQASIFENQNQETPEKKVAPAATNDNQDDLTTLLGSIKNDRGEPKYKNVQEALKALAHSQEYIPSLKQTKEELEQKLNEAMQKLSRVDELEQTVLQLTQRKDESPAPTKPAGLTEEQIAELVTRTLSKKQQEEIAKQNRETVVAEMKSAFGDKAEEVFYNKAKEMGMSVQEFNALAVRTPKAVLELLGVKKTQKQTKTPESFNTAGFQPKSDSLVGRNTKGALLGATTEDIRTEAKNAAAMVAELQEMGMSVYDLTDPKNYNKYFKGK